MARRVDTGVGSWLALGLLLVSSSVVLGLEWDKVSREGGQSCEPRTIAVCGLGQ